MGGRQRASSGSKRQHRKSIGLARSQPHGRSPAKRFDPTWPVISTINMKAGGIIDVTMPEVKPALSASTTPMASPPKKAANRAVDAEDDRRGKADEGKAERGGEIEPRAVQDQQAGKPAEQAARKRWWRIARRAPG